MTPNTTNFHNKNTNLGNRCLHLQQSLHPCLATKTLPSPKIWRQAGSQIPLMPFLHASQSGHQIKHKPFCLLFLQIIRIFSVTNQSKHIKTKAPKGLAPQAGLKLLLQCCCLIAAAKPARKKNNKKTGNPVFKVQQHSCKLANCISPIFSFPTLSCCSSTVAASQCERLAKAALPQIASSSIPGGQHIEGDFSALLNPGLGVITLPETNSHSIPPPGNGTFGPKKEKFES